VTTQVSKLIVILMCVCVEEAVGGIPYTVAGFLSKYISTGYFG